MKIELDAELLKSVVSEAILKSLDDEKRNALVQGAIQHLLTPEKTGAYSHGQPVTPLESAFRESMRWVAQKIIQEELEKREDIKEKIRGLLNDALIRLTDTNREATVASLAESIAKGMTHREY